MNPKKAFRKFGDVAMNAPPGAMLTVGVMWREGTGWRVMMQIDTALLHLSSKHARGLADIFDKHHRSPEYAGKTTGLEWVSPELRTLADEIDQKNARGEMPPDAVDHMAARGSA